MSPAPSKFTVKLNCCIALVSALNACCLLKSFGKLL